MCARTSTWSSCSATRRWNGGVDTGTALHCDRANAAYAEYLVARPDNADGFVVRALAEALNCESTRDFIDATYAGQVLAAF